MKRILASLCALAAAACASSSSSVQPTKAPPPAPPVVLATSTPTQSAAPLPYLAQLPPLIDRDLLFGDPEIAGGQISPNGKMISFLKPYRSVMNVWVKGVSEPFSGAKPMTADTKRPIRGYFWSQDSKYILYAQDKGGDENFRIYAVDPSAAAEVDSGVPPARDLTPFDNVQAHIYAVPKRDPKHILIGLNDRDASLHDVYRLDLSTGKRVMLFRNDQNVADWIFDLDGKLRAAERQTGDGGTEILRVEGKQLKPIYTCTFEESCGAVRFHKDRRRMYFITDRGNRDLAELVLLDAHTGKEQLVDRDPQAEVDFGGAVFSRATDELLGTYYVGDRIRIYPKRPDFQRDYEILKKELPDGDLRLVSQSNDDRWSLVAVTSDVEPAAVYLFDRKTKKVELLYRSRPKVPSGDLAAMKPVRYPARDGLSIPAYLTIPKNVEPKNLAVVINPHGGPWGRDRWGYNSWAQFLANRGYMVFQPNFRASTGYGKRFLNLGNNQWGTGTMQHDLTDGVKWLVAQGIADPKRVAILGGSYGGYATLAGVAFTPELYAAGVDIVGPSNIITLLNSIPPYWAPIKKTFAKRVGDVENPKDLERLKAQSPLFAAKQIRAPLLVIQGQNDPRVKRAESDQIVVAMRDLGLPVEYLVAPDEGHGYAGRENRLAMTVEIERFLTEHLGGRNQEGMADDIRQRLAALTVDVKSVKMPSAPAAVASGPMRSFSGGAVQPASAIYEQIVEVSGRKIEGTVTRTVGQAELDGRKTWKVVELAKSQMGSGDDTVWLDAETLLPLKRTAHQGMATIELDVADGQVKGEMKAGAQQMPINAKLDGPTLFDGASLEVALGTLPLESGYKTAIKTFSVMTAKSRTWNVEVAPKEKLDIQGKAVDAYRVDLTADDGSASKLWIEAASPRRVVKSESNLSTSMGTAKVTRMLQTAAGASAERSM
jgi:dipeptidyl aminopeptidase/acylaminoacyl peptidase